MKFPLEAWHERRRDRKRAEQAHWEARALSPALRAEFDKAKRELTTAVGADKAAIEALSTVLAERRAARRDFIAACGDALVMEFYAALYRARENGLEVAEFRVGKREHGWLLASIRSHLDLFDDGQHTGLTLYGVRVVTDRVPGVRVVTSPRPSA